MREGGMISQHGVLVSQMEGNSTSISIFRLLVLLQCLFKRRRLHETRDSDSYLLILAAPNPGCIVFQLLPRRMH